MTNFERIYFQPSDYINASFISDQLTGYPRKYIAAQVRHIFIQLQFWQEKLSKCPLLKSSHTCSFKVDQGLSAYLWPVRLFFSSDFKIVRQPGVWRHYVQDAALYLSLSSHLLLLATNTNTKNNNTNLNTKQDIRAIYLKLPNTTLYCTPHIFALSNVVFMFWHLLKKRQCNRFSVIYRSFNKTCCA